MFSLRKDPFATATYTSPRHRRPLYQDLSTPQDGARKSQCRFVNQDERKFETHFRKFVESVVKGGGGWMVEGGGGQRDLGASQTLLTDVKQWRIQRRGLGGPVGPPCYS